MILSRQARVQPTGDVVVDRAIRSTWEEIARVINGLISFGTADGKPGNMAGAWFSGTTSAGADTEFAVTHNLGRVPQGWLTISVDKAGVVYKGTTVWTNKLMYLKCNVASVTIKIFVV
jgi:hypothetical protein